MICVFYVYLVLSAVLIPVSDIFFAVLRESYSWWLVPLLFVGFFIGLVILHLAIFALSVAFVNVNSPAERGAKYYRFAVNITIPLLLKLCRVKVNASGVEKLPENTRFLLVCNHQHDFGSRVEAVQHGIDGIVLSERNLTHCRASSATRRQSPLRARPRRLSTRPR